MINLYVTSLRGLANGVALTGIGLGTVCHPFLQSYLIDEYGWRGALFIASALTLHTCAVGGLIRPLPSQPATKDVTTKDEVALKPREKLLDLQMFKRYDYWLLHLNCILFCFGLSVVFTHISAFAASVLGHSPGQCNALISVMGLANVLGRIILGALLSLNSINAQALLAACYGISGLAAFNLTLFKTFGGSLASVCFFAFGLAAYGPVLCEVVLVTVSIEHYASGYGLLLLSQALGTILGAPTAGRVTCNVYIGFCTQVLLAVPRTNCTRGLLAMHEMN